MIYVLLDPYYDARQAGLCDCKRCITRYVRIFRAAARRVVRRWVRDKRLPRGSQVEVVVGRYDGPDAIAYPSDQEPEGLWQAIHDDGVWVPRRGHKGNC